MEEKVLSILKQKNICTATGQPRENRLAVFQRVEKLIKLHPDDPVWVEGVARTAFSPNKQQTSFIDIAQERGLVDENYVPIDSEEYERLKEEWDDTVYEVYPRSKVEPLFEKEDEDRERMKFFNDDSECW